MPSPQGVFNEETLRAEIVSKWGEYGAHTEVFDFMVAEIKRLQSVVRVANAQLESSFAPLSGFEFISSNAELSATVTRALRAKEIQSIVGEES